MMAKRRIIILGAGLAGLSAAWHLQRRGLDCQIFEKEPQAGGLCRSKNINGFIFDYDGHLLHFKHRYTFGLVKSLLGDNLLEHQRSAWVYSSGRFTRYPFQANLYGLPPEIVKECLLGLIAISKNGHPKNKENLNFRDWVYSTFGEGIAKHFMLPYNTKFWTVPLERLSCEWLDGFIPVPSLSQTLEGTIEESCRQFGYNSRFWYPEKGGIHELPRQLARQVRNIHTDCQITEIDIIKKELKIASGNKEKFDLLISTIPLPETSHIIKGLPREIGSLYKKLKWNSIFNLNLGIDGSDNKGFHWVYFPKKELCFFRVGFSHNFSPHMAPSGKSSLYAEVAYSKDKPIDKNNIISNIKEDLKKVGTLKDDDRICIEDVNDIKYGYPIYDTNYSQTREKILKYLTHKNIVPCGRYGSWSYFSMEDAILDGKRAAALL